MKPLGVIGGISSESNSLYYQIITVDSFQWYALFIYWQYISHSIVKSVWGSTSADSAAYEQAVAWTGLVNGFYNVVTFVSSPCGCFPCPAAA